MATNGKKKVHQFLMLDYSLIHGPLWNDLSRSSRDVYEQIKSSRHIRRKKGEVINTDDNHIEFGYSDLKIKMARSTFYNSVKELYARGLIKVIDYGDFPRKKATYALSKKWIVYNQAMKIKEDSK